MKIIGTGSALPEKVVTNDMLAGFLETSDSWIRTRTGIETRRLLSTETLSELAMTAAMKALESSKMKPEDIDYIICSNVANSYVTPSLSSIIMGPLGCKCPCTDINGACVGFIYALDIADAFVKAGKAKIPARLINVVRASHKNEEEPPLYKPQSAQGTGKQETASFQKWHISNFFRMGNTSLLFPCAFTGFFEIGFRRILNFFDFFSKNRYPTGFSVWGY